MMAELLRCDDVVDDVVSFICTWLLQLRGSHALHHTAGGHHHDGSDGSAAEDTLTI